MEVWRPIPQSFYELSSIGRIRRATESCKFPRFYLKTPQLRYGKIASYHVVLFDRTTVINLRDVMLKIFPEVPRKPYGKAFVEWARMTNKEQNKLLYEARRTLNAPPPSTPRTHSKPPDQEPVKMLESNGLVFDRVELNYDANYNPFK